MKKTGKLSFLASLATIVAIAVAIGLMMRFCTNTKADDIVINAVSIAILEPAMGEAPIKSAQADGRGYAWSAVSWSPDDKMFMGNTVYTASVTLTAKADHAFSRKLLAKINNREATIISNNGKTVTISMQFDATLAKPVSSILITSQPDNFEYTHGDRINLSGLVVTLIYEDGETEDVEPVNFASKNITTYPANGAILSHTAHNDISIALRCSRRYAFTDNLTVNKAVPTIRWPSGITAVYEQTLADVSLESYSTGNIGSFSWVTPSDSVGILGTHSHTMLFSPDDMGNYYTVTNDINIRVLLGEQVEMVSVGTFTMGSPSAEIGRYNDETQWQVTLTGFHMGKYEVTQNQYVAVMGKNPSHFNANADEGENQGRRPVEMVNWYETLVFCNKLSVIDSLTPAYSIGGKTDPDEWGPIPEGDNVIWNSVTIVPGSNGYRLPTEAQWEFACRAGTTTTYNTGEAISDNTGWYSSNSKNKTHEVGLKPPNAWGLYDMHGNVFEWCWDTYGTYPTGAQTDPTGASSGSRRVIRGGGWNGSAQVLRSAYRGYPSTYGRGNFLGFRYLRPQ